MNKNNAKNVKRRLLYIYVHTLMKRPVENYFHLNPFDDGDLVSVSVVSHTCMLYAMSRSKAK